MQQSRPLDGELIPPGQDTRSPAPKARTDADIVLEELGEQNGRMALDVCDRIACEPLGLEAIAGDVCGMEDGASAARKFYRWRMRSSALRRMYAHACASRAHVLVNRMMDVIEAEPDPHRARVKMDALKWMAGKLNRADFGDEPQQGVSVTINNDRGQAALDIIRERIERKRKSMLTQTGGRVEDRGEGEGDVSTMPPALPSRTREGGSGV